MPAQAQDVTTTVSTIPFGLAFTVDGQIFTRTASFVWPEGSKHTLQVTTPVQQDPLGTTEYVFGGWTSGTLTLTQNPLIITADPSMTQFQASFSTAYQLSLRYYPCPDPKTCLSPGTVYVNGAPTKGDLNLFFGPGSQVTLQAVPNPGYVFAGWTPGLNQVIQGSLDTATVNGPMTVAPVFQVARTINFTTVPAGLEVLVDRGPMVTPTSVEWGWGSTHTVGPVSPQQDPISGQFWIFSSWSDGGDSTHAYTVAPLETPDTLTVTYVPGERVDILTSPAGFKISVDSFTGWATNHFLWGAGTTHVLSAPDQQTDSQGRIWTFTGWSNGAPATQSFAVPSDPVSIANGVSLTANYQAMGRLTISSSVAGVSLQVDGSACSTPCDIQRPQGSQVHVTAGSSPLGSGSRADFLSWSDGGAADRTFTLGDQPVQLTANYHVMNQLTLTSKPANGVTWSVQPSSPDGFYDSQTTVAINLTALPGFRFRQWAGDLSGTSPSGTLDMSVPRSVQALLDRVPYVAPPGVVNGAGTTPVTGLAPGSIGSIFGGMLANDTQLGPSSPLVQALAGVTVTIGDRILPLFYVSATQINFLLPSDLPLGDAVVTINSPAQTLNAPLTVVQDAPGLLQQISSDGLAFAVALHADGSAVSAQSPAQIGEVLTFYGTGFGATSPGRPSGFAIPSQPVFQVVDPVTVTIGSAAPVPPQSAYAAAGMVGVDAVQFSITDSSLSGSNVPVFVTVNGQNSNTVLVPVQ